MKPIQIEQLTDKDLISEYKKNIKLMELFSFNSGKLRRKSQTRACFLKAEIIRRNLEDKIC